MCARLHHSFVLCFCLILLCSFKLNEGNIIIHEDFVKQEDFSTELWSFGADIPTNGIEGVIVNANPPDACKPISEPPNVNFTLNWFVLVAGNSCDYDTKVFHSQLAGYSVAIIYKSKENNTDTFKHLDYIPTIPAVIIIESIACIIQENFLYSINKSIRAIIVSDEYTFVAKFLVVAVWCGIIVSIGYCLKMCLKLLLYLIKCCRLWASSNLKHLPISRYQAGDPYETCAICLEDFKIQDKLRILSCLHGYHVKCIDPWIIRYQRTCPVCKHRVVVLGVCESVCNETTPLLNNI